MLTVTPDGQTPDKPTVLGQPNGDEPIQVYSTGLYKSMMKGQTRWVTGTGVDPGLDNGVIVLIQTLAEEEDAAVERLRNRRGYSGPGLVDLDEAKAQVFQETVSSVDSGTPEVPQGTKVDAHLAGMSKAELVKLAREVGLEGRAAMDKSELYEHLRHHPGVEAQLS